MNRLFELFKKIEKKPEDKEPVSYLVVGLGNPGLTYDKTRHNAGFIMLSSYLESQGIRADRSRFDALVGEGRIGTHRALFMFPQTFMNNSGKAVSAAAKYYKIPLSHVIVICDDINLDVGRMRIRAQGSDGGQKGLRSIIEYFDSEDFPRIRIGVGQKPTPEYDLVDWVLSHFTEDDLGKLKALGPYVEKALLKITEGDIPGAMQDCNGVSV